MALLLRFFCTSISLCIPRDIGLFCQDYMALLSRLYVHPEWWGHRCVYPKYYRALSLKNIGLLCSKYGPLLSRLNRTKIVRAADISNSLCIPKNVRLFRHKYRSLSHKYRALLPRLMGTRMVRAADVSCSLCIPENVWLFRHKYKALYHKYRALLSEILRTWMVRAADVSCSLCIPNSTSIPSSR